MTHRGTKTHRVRGKDKERIRNLPAFISAYLASGTGQRLLNTRVEQSPKLALAFAAAVGVVVTQVGQPA